CTIAGLDFLVLQTGIGSGDAFLVAIFGEEFIALFLVGLGLFLELCGKFLLLLGTLGHGLLLELGQCSRNLVFAHLQFAACKHIVDSVSESLGVEVFNILLDALAESYTKAVAEFLLIGFRSGEGQWGSTQQGDQGGGSQQSLHGNPLAS